jgi:serpin B
MLRTLSAALLLVALVGCDATEPDVPTDPTPIELSPLAASLVGQSNDFGTALFAEVAAGDDANLMLSPLSASVALTMLLNGADGETYDQIHEMLGYAPGMDLDAVNAAYESLREQLLAADPNVQFTLANAVFYDRAYAAGAPLKAPFLDAMRGPFDARVEALDFGAPSALDAVNGWADESTNGKVPTVLDQIDPDLVMFLLNALYFKGEWSDSFDEDQTAPADFRLASGETIRVPTMSGEVQGLTVRGDGYQALELAYGRRNFSFVALMPDDGTALPDFARQLAGGLWTDATAQLDALSEWGEVTVRLPRFTFETAKKLNDPLKALGMVDAFTDGADLTRIAEDDRLYVSFVKQDSFVEVNEEGTEAAAVTTVAVGVESAGPFFAADRPFVFAIRERTTNTLLFIGQVADPSS